MLHRIRQFVCLALMMGMILPAVAQKAKPRARRKAPPAKMTPAQPAQPAPPAPPPTPEQMPPSPPRVSYQNNQLSIVADNSTLADVLNMVRARTGAKVDMPGTVAGERVAVRLGPGEPRDVLAQLLAGSRYDFVLLGSAGDPSVVTDIVLTPHAGGTAVASAASAAALPSSAPQPPSMMRPPNMPADDEADESEPQPQPEPPLAEPVPQPQRPPQGAPGMQQPPQPQTLPGQQAPGTSNPQQPKTPEQLLQELQRMQQQEQERRQQQQQQQPQQPPPGT